MMRLLVALTVSLLVASCNGFVIGATGAMKTSSVAQRALEADMFFGGAKAAPKKPAKKVFGKKVAKTVTKPAPGMRALEANKPGTSPTQLVGDFFSEKNWLYQAFTL